MVVVVVVVVVVVGVVVVSSCALLTTVLLPRYYCATVLLLCCVLLLPGPVGFGEHSWKEGTEPGATYRLWIILQMLALLRIQVRSLGHYTSLKAAHPQRLIVLDRTHPL